MTWAYMDHHALPLFGSDAYVVSEATPDHLLITVPASALGWPWFYVFMVALFLVATYTTSRSVRRVMRPLLESPEKLHAYVRRYRIIMTIGLFGSLGAFWLLGYSSGSIELDRRANLATMRAKFTAFLPAEQRAAFRSGSGDARLQAEFAAHPAGHQ